MLGLHLIFWDFSTFILSKQIVTQVRIPHQGRVTCFIPWKEMIVLEE